MRSHPAATGFLFAMVFAAWFAASSFALAQGINIGGQDNSGQMKELQNVLTTLQIIGFKWVGPLMGGALVLTGLFLLGTRRFVPAIFAMAGGGCLFFVEKIATGLSNLGGGAG
jgi:hypothetical protein